MLKYWKAQWWEGEREPRKDLRNLRNFVCTPYLCLRKGRGEMAFFLICHSFFFVKYVDKPGCWFFNSALKISKSSLAERIRLLFLFEYRVASCVAFSFKFIFSCVSRHIDCKGLRAKKELRDQFHFIKISLKVKKPYLSEDWSNKYVCHVAGLNRLKRRGKMLLDIGGFSFKICVIYVFL